MKWTLFGFNQQRLADYGLDIVDAAILRWFVDFYQTDAMVKIRVDGKPDHVWVKYAKIIEDLPTLGFTDIRQVSKRFDKFCAKEVMSKTKVHRQRGTFVGFYLSKTVLEEFLRKPEKKTSSVIKASVIELEKLQSEYLESGREKYESADSGVLPFEAQSENADAEIFATANSCTCKSLQLQKNAVPQQQNSAVAIENSSTKEFIKKAAAASENTEKSIENLEKTYKNALIVCETLSSALKDVKDLLISQQQKSAVADLQQQKSVVADSQQQKSVVAKILQTLSPQLVFDENFYEKAASFLQKNQLPQAYFEHVYKCVKNKDGIKDIRSFYFKLFFADDILALFKTEQEESVKKELLQKTAQEDSEAKIKCPACQMVFDKRKTDFCPDCLLPLNCHNNPEQIEFYREQNDARFTQMLSAMKKNRRINEKEDTG